MTSQSLNSIFDMITRDTIGLASQIERLNQLPHSTFPPHNIIDIGDGKYVIELAVAGYSEKDISITVEDNKLTISGDKPPLINAQYVHRGIAYRSFSKEFVLSEYVEVKNARINNGLLIVELEQQIPDSKKPRRIIISK